MTGAWMERARGQIDLPLLQRHPLVAAVSVVVGLPLSLVWSCVAGLRAMRRQKMRASQTNGRIRIISVGNVAVGGTGKSPVVRAITRQALSEGHDVVILSRGYGSSAAAREDQMVCIDSQSTGEAELFWNIPFSDEGIEHAVLLKGMLQTGSMLWIAQGSDRRRLLDKVIQARAKNSPASMRPLVVLLDDGLSQTALPVHCDVVLWDPHSLLQAPRACLPYGPYRMGWPWILWPLTIPQADRIVWSRLKGDHDKEEFLHSISLARRVLKRVRNDNECMAVERAFLAKAVGFSDDGRFRLEDVSVDALAGRLTVLTGFARPQRFIETLRTLSVGQNSSQVLRPVEVVHLSDHAELNDSARDCILRSDLLVTSLKDLCRWRLENVILQKIRDFKVCVLCLEVDLVEFGQSSSPAGGIFPPLNKEGTHHESSGA